jgi:uridine kinase
MTSTRKADKTVAIPLQSPDRPINGPEEDQLERGGFIGRLCSAVIDPDTTKATGVIVGITGPWGSGKSSILNLLDIYVRKQHPDAVIVRFDPWLVSGRNDLISEFIAELIAELRRKPDLRERLKSTISKLVNYGATLRPLAEFVPYSAAIKGALEIAKARLDRSEGLHEQRDNLIDALSKVPSAILVLIDELDRVEDEEIRVLAQLVRSVADFPGISYVLAYDAERVMRALAGAEGLERGRAYLEKIVQLQIPLPVVMDNEIFRLVEQDLDTLSATGLIPSGRGEIKRYVELRNLLIPRLISTPRDVKRLTGTYSTLLRMLVREVDWIDLIGFCALLVKAPLTAERIKGDPDLVADDPTSIDEIVSRASDSTARAEIILNRINPENENESGPAIRRLLAFLFPRLSDDRIGRHYDQRDNAVGISKMRTLLTALRLDLVPGFYSREQVLKTFALPSVDLASFLRDSYRNDRLGHYLQKMTDLAGELCLLDQRPFWQGVGQFLKKPDDDFILSYSPMREFVQSFAAAFLKVTGKASHALYLDLLEQEEVELTSSLMRSHIFHHGLFGHTPSGRGGDIFLDSGESEAIASDLSAKYRGQHLHGRFLWSLWEWNSLYTMLDTGAWDNDCRLRLKQFLTDHEGVDALTLMLFGGRIFTGRDSISKMVDLDYYLECVDSRLDEGDLDESVRVALERAKNPPFG